MNAGYLVFDRAEDDSNNDQSDTVYRVQTLWTTLTTLTKGSLYKQVCILRVAPNLLNSVPLF